MTPGSVLLIKYVMMLFQAGSTLTLTFRVQCLLLLLDLQYLGYIVRYFWSRIGHLPGTSVVEGKLPSQPKLKLVRAPKKGKVKVMQKNKSVFVLGASIMLPRLDPWVGSESATMDRSIKSYSGIPRTCPCYSAYSVSSHSSET